MEDEYHVLTVCHAYQEIRNVLLDSLKNEQNVTNWNIHVFPNEKPKPQKLIAKHVFECFKMMRKMDQNMCLCVCNYRYLK